MAYYPASYKEAKASMEAWLKDKGLTPMKGPIQVETLLFVARPKTTKKLWPKGDNDNYEKGVWDALNGHAWEDDDQIVLNTTVKLFTKLDPRIEVRVRKFEVPGLEDIDAPGLIEPPRIDIYRPFPKEE